MTDITIDDGEVNCASLRCMNFICKSRLF